VKVQLWQEIVSDFCYYESMIYKFLGIASAVIFIICDFPYLLDALRAKTKPHRVTWGIIVLLNLIGFANQLASGAHNSLWLFVAAIVMSSAIFVASLKNGVGGHTRQDMFAIVACFVGLALWGISNSPLFSIFANMTIAVIALAPTIAKAKKHPETETKIAWSGGTLSALLATISVGTLNWRLLILPMSSTLLQGYMAYILYFRAKYHQPSTVKLFAENELSSVE
jgi:hypothetical protein